MSVISVYAPTYNSPQEEKDKFYDDLQQVVVPVPEDHLLLFRDFNARVESGCSELEKYQWVGVRGSHGVGKMNKRGAVLLSFCALNYNCFSTTKTCLRGNMCINTPGNILTISCGTALIIIILMR